MRADTRAFVEDCWAEIFGCGRNDLWVGTQVTGHAGLGEYPGVWVAWRDAGVHVSLPTTVAPHEAESLATQGIETLADPAWWSTFAADRGWVLVGPAVHAYLDEDPGNDGTVSRIDPALLAGLRASVAEDEWHEAGFAAETGDALGFFADGRLVAAAGFSDFGDAPRDVGLLVASDTRGRGLGHLVGGAAASYAVRKHGFAVWRAFVENTASLAISRALGFEAYCHQLAVRPAR